MAHRRAKRSPHPEPRILNPPPAPQAHVASNNGEKAINLFQLEERVTATYFGAYSLPAGMFKVG